jgi:hypothetical protein
VAGNKCQVVIPETTVERVGQFMVGLDIPHDVTMLYLLNYLVAQI